jgi:hypothetical protein
MWPACDMAGFHCDNIVGRMQFEINVVGCLMCPPAVATLVWEALHHMVYMLWDAHFTWLAPCPHVARIVASDIDEADVTWQAFIMTIVGHMQFEIALKNERASCVNSQALESFMARRGAVPQCSLAKNEGLKRLSWFPIS